MKILGDFREGKLGSSGLQYPGDEEERNIIAGEEDAKEELNIEEFADDFEELIFNEEEKEMLPEFVVNKGFTEEILTGSALPRKKTSSHLEDREKKKGKFEGW